MDAEPTITNLGDIVDRIMAAHWDVIACQCWVCQEGRRLGCAPLEQWLSHRNGNRERYPVPPDWRWQ